MRKIALTVILCMALCGTAACSSGQPENAEVATEMTTEVPEATTEAAVTKTIPLNTETQIGDWNVMVTGSETSDRIEDDGLYFELNEEGNRYFIINASVENTGKQVESFISSYPVEDDYGAKIVYGDGYEYNVSNLLGYSKGLLDNPVNPLTSKDGQIVFEVPKDVADSDGPFTLNIYNSSETYNFTVK